MIKKCKCGKDTTTGRCKSCSNRDRAGKYHPKRPTGIIMHRPKGIIMNWKNKMFGEKNPNWKGDKVGLIALHEWIKNHKPKPDFCEECNKVKPFDLSNISGEYKRDINDFRWLCRSCHMKEDYKNGVRKPIDKESFRREHFGDLIYCNGCKSFKERTNFGKNKYVFDGYNLKCKNCYNKIMRTVNKKHYNKYKRLKNVN